MLFYWRVLAKLSLPDDKYKPEVIERMLEQTKVAPVLKFHSINKLIVKMVTYLNALIEWNKCDIDCVQTYVMCNSIANMMLYKKKK